MPSHTFRTINRLAVLATIGCLPFVYATPAASAVSVQLTGPLGSSGPVGTPVQWTASDAANDGLTLQYRWSIVQNGQTVMFRDFFTDATISFAPINEGPYTVTVVARDAANASSTGTATASFTASSLVGSGGGPVVVGTTNPLVAVYSMTCESGSARVMFAPAGAPISTGTATPSKPCISGQSVNFVIAGMRQNTTYNLMHEIASSGGLSTGPQIQFTTGAIPSSVPIPAMTVQGATAGGEGIMLNAYLGGNNVPIAYDTSGNVVWFNYPLFNDGSYTMVRPMNGGTMILTGPNWLQEVDLLGNIVRETNVNRVGEELTGSPFNIINSSIPNRIANFSHDAIRLPNGNTVVLSAIEQIANQGQGNVDVLGDAVLVLDQNWQVVWAWNPFTQLDVMRPAVLGETCQSYQGGCPLLTLVPSGGSANDWTHANSLWYTPDGNIVVSLRHQDWVIKIDYANGTGNGNVIWHLGNQGDFALTGGQQWFSHQHNVSVLGQTVLLFDNANGDYQQFGGSRGLQLTINETTKTANIDVDSRLGVSSLAVGSAERLRTANLWYLWGFANGVESYAGEFNPTRPLATPQVTYHMKSLAYRSFRLDDLYTTKDLLHVEPPPALQFVPVTACRVADTRDPNSPFGGPELAANTSREFVVPNSPCGIPANAAAYSLQVTAVPDGQLNYLTVWPSWQEQPYVSTLNSDGRIKTVAAVVGAGAAGAVSVYATDPTHVVLDVTGYFVPANTASALSFYPLAQCRIADTRNGGLFGSTFGAGETRSLPVLSSTCNIPSTAQAYSLNFTVAPHQNTLYALTAWPAGQSQPYPPTLTDFAGTVTANAAIVPAGSNGNISVNVSHPADVIVDINGYFAPPGAGGLSFYASPECRELDTRTSTGVFSGAMSQNITGSACYVPTAAEGFLLNSTIVPPAPATYLALWSDGQAQPPTSTLDAWDGSIMSNLLLTGTNAGSVNVFSSDPTQLVLDVFGYFAP